MVQRWIARVASIAAGLVVALHEMASFRAFVSAPVAVGSGLDLRARASTIRSSSIPRSGAANALVGPRTATSCSNVTTGLAPSVPALLLAGALLASGRRTSRGRSDKGRIVALKGVGNDATSKDTELAQAEALRLEAARLRAEVSDLQDEKEQEYKREQARLFGVFDQDKSGGIDLDELQKGLKQFWGIDLEESVVARLIESLDDNHDGVLQPEEFDLRSMEATLGKIQKEDRVKLDTNNVEERQRLETERLRLERGLALDQYLSGLPETNEDTGPLIRIGAVFAYLLPALDSLRFCSYIASHLPLSALVISPLSDAASVVNQVPFGAGALVLFVTFQSIANNTELPRLLRFNMRQSVLLTLSMFFPGIVGTITNLGAAALLGSNDQWGQWVPGSVPTAIADPANSIVFLLVWGMIAYSVISSLIGVEPTGIPGISSEAERTMAQTRDSRLESRLRRQLEEAESLTEAAKDKNSS